MKVRMIKTVKGSPNGVEVHTFYNGMVYSVPDELGQVFLDNGQATVIIPTANPIKAETITKGPAPENKTETPDENKRSPGRPRKFGFNA